MSGQKRPRDWRTNLNLPANIRALRNTGRNGARIPSQTCPWSASNPAQRPPSSSSRSRSRPCRKQEPPFPQPRTAGRETALGNTLLPGRGFGPGVRMPSCSLDDSTHPKLENSRQVAAERTLVLFRIYSSDTLRGNNRGQRDKQESAAERVMDSGASCRV